MTQPTGKGSSTNLMMVKKRKKKKKAAPAVAESRSTKDVPCDCVGVDDHDLTEPIPAMKQSTIVEASFR